MTSTRIPRPDPGGPRLRPFDEQVRREAADRTTQRLALAALVVSVLALCLVAWHALVPAGAGCQDAAWSTTPDASQLPAGWSVASSQYDIARKTMSILGPAPADQSVARAVVYATVTCYADGAADAVKRSADAATAAGQVVSGRDDLGDQGFSAADDSGAIFLQFRHDRLVVYLAASGDATAAEVDALAAAFDRSLGGDGGAPTAGSPGTASAAPTDATETPAPTDDASASPGAAPELEAVLPAKVGAITMTVDSATGSMVLGDDQGSRAITAALRAEGKAPDDFRIAQAFDVNGESDLTIYAFAVTGLGADKVRTLVLDSWLAASGAGVAKTAVTLDGREFTRVDYGDDGAKDYVGSKGDVIVVITTSDPELAAAAAAALR